MKAFLWVVLISFLGLCGYYYFKAFIIPDETQMLSIAFGNTTDDEVELHVEVTLVMAQLDVFPYMSMNGGTDWKAWANDHYIVKDDGGNQVEFTKRMKSNVISERDSRVVADGYLIAKLKPGAEYTFEYIPIISEPEKFLYEFSAPTEDASRVFVTFQPNF